MDKELFDNLNDFYENQCPEDARLDENGLQYPEFLLVMDYFNRVFTHKSRILDPCAGTGAYAFALAAQGHCVTAGDLIEFNTDKMRQRQLETPLLEDIYTGNIEDLSRFSSNSFDAVLCMGALYHMPKEAQRRKAVEESLRVLKPGGILVCTYMNRFGVLLQNMSGSLDNLDEMIKYAKDGLDEIFYAATPMEISALLDEYSLSKLFHVGIDGIGYFLLDSAKVIDLAGYARYQEFHKMTCDNESILGYSMHGMYIGRKFCKSSEIPK